MAEAPPTEQAQATASSGNRFPLVKMSDMPDEMRQDAIETVSTAIETTLEKQPTNYEGAAKLIKQQMDKKYGRSWHVFLGEGFGFSVTYELKNLLYVFFDKLAILVFKAM